MLNQAPTKKLSNITFQDSLDRAPLLQSNSVIVAGSDKPLFTRLKLYPKQSAIVDDQARFTICEATTKAGKTMSHIEWLLDEAIKEGAGNWWWVATTTGTADIAFRRACDRLRGYLESGGERKKVSDPISFKPNLSLKTIEVNGAILWFKTAEKPDHLYGEDVRAVVGDEITRWRESAWIAVYTTLTATKGKAKLIGNVKGRHNFAYRLARKAQAGAKDWAYHRLTALDAIEGGVIDSEIVDQAKKDLPDHLFKELYYAEASEDGTNPFNLNAIGDCVAEFSTYPVVAWGVDLGRKRDWTVAIGLDAYGAVAQYHRWIKFPKWAQTEAKIIELIGDTPALVDCTGVGDRVVEALQEKCGNIQGFTFTERSRQQLLEGLEIAIGTGEVHYPDSSEAYPVRTQLESFEIEHTRTGVKYVAPDSMPDDDVMALALAKMHQRQFANRPALTREKITAFKIDGNDLLITNTARKDERISIDSLRDVGFLSIGLDYSSICRVWVDQIGRCYVIEVVRRQSHPQAMVDEYWRLHAKRHFEIAGIETATYEMHSKAFEIIEEMHFNDKDPLPIYDVELPVDRASRHAATLQSAIATGQIAFSEHLTKLAPVWTQMVNLQSSEDDSRDSLAGAFTLAQQSL